MSLYYRDEWLTLFNGDAAGVLPALPDESVACCVTSPPYWGLRDYGVDGQLGLERTPEEYVSKLVAIFREVRRVLREDGTLWVNLGDSYAGGGRGGDPEESKHRKQATNIGSVTGATKSPWPIPSGLKPKDLVGIPWRVAFALQADGWYLRSDIIWAKPNPMPESVRDRPTKAHEFIFLLAKSESYYYNADAIAEPIVYGEHRRNGVPGTVVQSPGQVKQAGFTQRRSFGGDAESYGGARNRRSVWSIPTQPFPEAHFAVFPEKLVEPCILAGCPEGATVLDPFAGAGTVGVVARRFGNRFIGIELNESYCQMALRRMAQGVLSFHEATS